jgi:transposase InsO family protein
MWPNLIVVSTPSLAFSHRVVEAHEPVLVQALRPELAVEPKAGEACASRKPGTLHRLTIDAGIEVYFCDPQSPWQRGTNENTNGVLRQYFPKGTDLSAHSARELAAVTATLNARPRKTLGWKTPAEALDQCLR